MAFRGRFAEVAPSGPIVMSGATTGFQILDQALGPLAFPGATSEGGPPTGIDPKFCKLHGCPPQGDAEYYRWQCLSLEEPDTQSNSSEKWVHSHPEWFDPDEDLSCYTGDKD